MVPIMTEKKKHPEWLGEDLSPIAAMPGEFHQPVSLGPVISGSGPCSRAFGSRVSVSGKIVLICQD